ncbi:Eaf6p KNAG_0D01520 [Huiozyma naganishii CBS 8797]|uniref:Chromatin modification-related protein EAF6 n=1 Tax=Huiozyma naganishii (strain ATCC MYA-139 / BCRC 22969 / CBS 8797 / KCTC 17520 / NBRC 10181 / NCYC 3082 / Yp74L-3) TaxID=1071383 RepID=J7S5L4_HUIN7|nr:hypothetical protein KNAG_0D01520 [Kazachstania naganishii CBS 8797]CCK69904.1 hypothetical protein KNAG_0D01520 [Kazachstania naganishii CBS 8797]
MEEDPLKQYEQLKSDLSEALKQRRQYEDELDALQQEIYDKETEYFTSTTYISSLTSKPLYIPGNIIKGFEGFSKAQHHSGGSNSAANDYHGGIPNEDRIFSLSSAAFQPKLPHNTNQQPPSQQETNVQATQSNDSNGG